MYVFSATGVAKKDMDGIQMGQEVPFIVYISFKDLFGAEKLCQLYLIRAGFKDIKIEKHKHVSQKLLDDSRVVNADKPLKDALQSGYHIQMFDAH
ncbi:MAG: hypothetical protein MI864_27315 [Pseudomonadales bacterium]|uniref:Uncharacterized protein n=2 Tax=Oleiphilus messinensis TaxID=141451 RepID=A0A1Y0ICD4_9GAMM|nr:hypothetical protein OLMES_4206 [Oleiphilus messinensis]MCG8614238.1 hypothetical protein [Pseudomonadales bacterium]